MEIFVHNIVRVKIWLKGSVRKGITLLLYPLYVALADLVLWADKLRIMNFLNGTVEKVET